MSGSFTSSGLHETMRTQGRPESWIAGKADDVVLDDHVGRDLVDDLAQPRRRRTARRRISACQVGSMNSASCSIVGLRKTGAVSRMKSFQNWPGLLLDLGRRRRGASAAPRIPSPRACPANDSSTTKTTRCPRSRSTWPIPTQLFVGP